MILVLRQKTTAFPCKPPLLKESCSVCSQNCDHASKELPQCFVQRLKIHVKNPSKESVLGTSKEVSNELEEKTIVAKSCIWFSVIETDQSCDKKYEQVPVFFGGVKSRKAGIHRFWLRLHCKLLCLYL